MPLRLDRHRNGFWYVTGTVTVWRNGEPFPVPVHRSTRSRNEAEAEGIRRQIENATAEQNITGKEPALTFNQAAARYVKQGGEARFLDKPKAHLGLIRIDQIDQRILDDSALKAYPLAADSTRRRQFHAPVIAVLRANGIERLLKRPADRQKRTIFMLPEQAVGVIEQTKRGRWPNPWAPALTTFLFGQGSRVGETLAIDGKNDISLEHRYAILRDTKSGKERMVTLRQRTIAALSTLPNLGDKGPLFLRYDGRPYEPREDRGYHLVFWENAVTRAGFDPRIYTPHTARHSWATWFYSQTKDVVRLKKEGGWDSNEWERYVKLANDEIGAAAAQYGFRFGQNTENADSQVSLKVV